MQADLSEVQRTVVCKSDAAIINSLWFGLLACFVGLFWFAVADDTVGAAFAVFLVPTGIVIILRAGAAGEVRRRGRLRKEQMRRLDEELARSRKAHDDAMRKMRRP